MMTPESDDGRGLDPQNLFLRCVIYEHERETSFFTPRTMNSMNLRPAERMVSMSSPFSQFNDTRERSLQGGMIRSDEVGFV